MAACQKIPQLMSFIPSIDPFLMPTIQVDRGAIKFLLSGANVMAPGLLTAGGRLPDTSKGEQGFAKGTPVAIMAQDKESALSIGILKESSDEIRAKGKGMVVDNIHSIGGKSERMTTLRAPWLTLPL